MDKIKSSTKKVLGGVCLFLVLILVKAVSSDFGKEYAHKFLYSGNEQINNHINEMFKKQKFPLVVDEYTTLVNASAQGVNINYYYVLNDFNESFFDADILKREVRKNIKKQGKFCDLLKDYKYTAKYNYKLQGSNKTPITIDITYKDCQ
ncbi:hypothetical protein RDB90_002169 [Salmonella enterica]|nr:hypothetical protein [Salmonella enterica subsp. diarizonae]EDK9458856.1 hypothetical protein [Salmonella enterica]EDQ3842308.1 hypothetical protein [Salmonella enterica subsp. enterica serovar Bareilly]ECI0840403.1 hypothetical protein [Salmonella enterica subsp. diarizonae]EDZ9221011.1 hypothetical protein [Salmonella enterica]